MNENKRNFKMEVKEWWSEHGSKVKIGAKCLAAGLLIGLVKGVLTESKLSASVHSKLIDKIPYEPDCDDIAEYIHDHIDELRPYIEAEVEFSE
jgi:hypothetical protein